MRSDRYNPNPPPYLLYGFLGVSLVVNLYLAWNHGSSDTTASVLPTGLEDAEAVEAGQAPAEPSVAVAASAEVIAMDAAPQLRGMSLVHGVVSQTLSHTFQDQAGEKADAVAAVYSRLFMWDLDLRRDLRKGDEVWAVWRETETGEIEIPVAWFKSQKLGQTLKAYQYKAPGDAHVSYWFPDGTEVPLRLVASPIENYEQITSLLKDRPTHKGMDFKADVGTEVLSSKAGTVTRINWNWKANGNCVEVRYADGTLAKFLHLEKILVTEGQHVASAQVIAHSGNTGHSTAPHLHYQLDVGEKVVDPIDYHGTIRRKLPANAMEPFGREMARLDAMLGEPVAAR